MGRSKLEVIRHAPLTAAKEKDFREKAEAKKEIIRMAIAYVSALFGKAYLAVCDALSSGFYFLTMRHLHV